MPNPQVPEEAVERFQPAVDPGMFGETPVAVMRPDSKGGFVRAADFAAFAAKVRKQEREHLSQRLAFIRGHLEGYADALGLTESVNKEMLVKSLREDAAALEFQGQVENADA